MNFSKIREISEGRAVLSEFASKNSSAYRLRNETCDIRMPYAVDRDRILYSGAFRRYAGKTQVVYFSQQTDEQLSNRIIHTQFVSQIARTIGGFLGLNLDLLEAAALGHDLGHAPFGHDGERFLSELTEKAGIGKFNHNVHSLYIVDMFSYHGKGMNLTFQTRDAIISHNGEIHEYIVSPNRNKNENDITEYCKQMEKTHFVKTSPATLEGALIRVSDTIAYIGSDLEDAIRMEVIKRDDIPIEITDILGNNNSRIIDTLVKDVVVNSFEKDYIAYSEKVGEALKKLKQFNYDRIYKNPLLKNSTIKIKKGFEILFGQYLEDLETGNYESSIYSHFLNTKNSQYVESASNYHKVRDFIASMTDRYFSLELNKIIMP
ncbi:MAG: HD domain-containing protein [Candidatus Delongbacteria bacterium]|nr:HD domain-containing protein [Candidatus Delongbacteria bacterium]MBN2835160.1 HD domain-containing protein [Candidatus Delongbacteria bacterium]